MKKAGLEFRVGLFVIVAAGVLGVLVIKAGDFTTKPGYTVRMIFDSVSGIDPGSPVRLAGVNVGQVKQVRVIRNEESRTQVEVVTWVEQGVYIEDDAESRISSLGILGEKYIEVLPGTAGAKPVGDGGVLGGKTPMSMERISESGGRLIQKLEKAVDSINEVVAEEQFKDSVRNTFVKAEGTFGSAETVITDLKEASADLKDAARSARIVLGRLRDGEGTVGKLLKDDTIAKELEAFVKEIKKNPWKLLKKS
ncbi:MAG: hypothetical protein MOGMAGMI_01204 [Candidatus Omnitrophica bacterium]|nr:hypothetical protein [Candidatus Omnitrophota bacterium]